MFGPEKVALIRDMYKDYGSYSSVAKNLKINRMTVARIVKRDPNRAKAKTGSPKLISARDNTLIKKIVRDCNLRGEKCTARKLQTECHLQEVSTRTIQRHMKTIKFPYLSAIKTIRLTKEHKLARVEKVKSWAAENVDWSIVKFTDEKRFSLDGPDSWSTYTDDRKNIERNKRQNGGGGIMVWDLISSDGFFYLIEIIGKFNSTAYCNIILDEVKPLLDFMYGEENYILQQDNCSIHSSAETNAHLETLRIRLLNWPARSPDLNIIENVWSWMVEYVYNKKSQYSTKAELWEAIQEAVSHINLNMTQEIKNLYNSIPTRHIKVIEGKGDTIGY